MDLQNQQIRAIAKSASIYYKNPAYVADRVFPVMDNAPKTGKVAKYDQGAWFRDEAKLRAPGTSVSHGEFGISYVNFDPKQYAFGTEVTFEDLRAQGFDPGTVPPVDLEKDSMEFVMDKILLAREIRTASVIFNQTWCGGNNDAAGQWARTVAAGSNTFIDDIRLGRKTIRDNRGILPNKLLLDFNTWEHIQDNPDLIARVPTTKDRIINRFDLATYLGIDEVIIGGAIKNTANEKLTDTFTAGNVWENTATKGSAFLYYAPPKIGLRTQSAGGTFRMKMFDGSPIQTTRRRNDTQYRWDYEAMEETDIVVIDSYCGYLFTDTIST